MAAADRACELVELLGAGEVVGGWIDVDNSVKEPTRIPLSADWINRFLALPCPKAEMISILERLGSRWTARHGHRPSYRADGDTRRMWLRKLPEFTATTKIPGHRHPRTAEGRLTAEQILREIFPNRWLRAAMRFPPILYQPQIYDKINLPADSAYRNSIVITNPLGEDTSVMRTIAIPSMLEVLARNYNNRNLSMRAYEIATEYTPTQPEQLPVESKQLLIGMYGEGCDFFALKGIVEELFDKIGLTGWDVAADETNPTFHPGRCARLTVGETLIGYLGEIHPAVQGKTMASASGPTLPPLSGRSSPTGRRNGSTSPCRSTRRHRGSGAACGEDLPGSHHGKGIQKDARF